MRIQDLTPQFIRSPQELEPDCAQLAPGTWAPTASASGYN
jgi:hypothetical protein